MAVTRNDVARLANVSPAVVSYVVNDGPRPVAATTRQRVIEAIDALGYQPDGLARSLRSGRTRTIGLVLPDGANAFFAELARVIENAAYARGLAVFVCNTSDDPERERAYVRSLAERRVDGLIIVPTGSGGDMSNLTRLAIPVVALDRMHDDDSVISTVRADNEAGACEGTSHLLGHGHTRIAFVGGPASGVSEDRALGWRRALRDAGLPDGPSLSTEFSFAGGAAAAKWLIAGHPDVTAVLVSSDVQGIGMTSALIRAGRGVPGDIALVAIDGTTAGAYALPSLTSVAQPMLAMAEAAVAQMTQSAGTVHLVLPNTLIPRGSCGCAPSQATSM